MTDGARRIALDGVDGPAGLDPPAIRVPEVHDGDVPIVISSTRAAARQQGGSSQPDPLQRHLHHVEIRACVRDTAAARRLNAARWIRVR